MKSAYDPACRQCPRLASFLQSVKNENPTYFCKPVPPFGAARPRLLIVGLAPGMHGANATGRPFTGDYAGKLLYATLYKFGFSSKAESVDVGDGLELYDCRITNAVKCLPPENKPIPQEIGTCNAFLRAELSELPRNAALLALGGIAHRAILQALDLGQTSAKFSHGAQHALPTGHMLFDSYHCSRYNTNTRRLSEASFHDVFANVRQYMKHFDEP